MLLSLLSNPGAGHALTNTSGVVAWGENSYGQLNIPADLSGVTAISAGHWHNLALKNDGTVVAWGCGSYDYGQCAVPAGLSDVTAVAGGYDHSLALKSDGTVVAWGNNSQGQTDVPVGLSGVAAIAGGYQYSLALKNDGTVVAWGYNYYGQANIPAVLNGVTAVAAGLIHGLALKGDGTVVAWGWNGTGQTAVPAGLSGVTAIGAGNDFSLALKDDGTVVAWGGNNAGQTDVPAGLSGVTAIAAGAFHSLALKNDGTVVAWGRDDDYFHTSVPAGLNSVTAIAAGEKHSLALGQIAAAPVAEAASVSTDEDSALAITLVATDADSAALTYSIVTTPAHGALSGTAPNVTYTPDVNWNGADHFTFKANDGSQDSNTATVTITVNPVNDAPLAVDQSVATPRNTPLAITLTATDVENASLTYTVVTVPTHGSLSGTAPNLTYTPDQDYAGDDFIYFSANDGQQTGNVAIVHISVYMLSHHPVALNDSYSTYQNTTLTIPAPGVLSNDTDEDGDPLAVHQVSIPAHGTLTLNFDGSFEYMPTMNYAGQDTFTYRAVDGEQVSNLATVTITVSQISNFTGFFQPVDNPGPGPRYVFNGVKAGSAIPVKFSLGGDQGLDIFSPGYPISRPVKCTTAARTDPIEQTVSAGNSSLNYDSVSGIYTYIWKTENIWAGTCRVLTVQLGDGTQHLAYFRFK
jgi:hypothetical protein